MKKWMKILLAILGLMIVVVLAVVYFYGPNFNIYLLPPSAKKYGEIAIDRMENGLYASGEDWEQTKSSALDQFESAETYEDTYPVLEEAIEVAGGKHSFLVFPDQDQHEVVESSLPATSLEEGILILTLPAFSSGDPEENQAYADILNQALQEKDYEAIIVNLADNNGGDMGPMISGLSSLIPDGEVISFEYRNGQTQEVILDKGSVQGGRTPVTVEDADKISDVPVAVIINEFTGSSGEMVALAFKGLDHVQFFGEDSAGYTSGNSQMSLYDGTIMQLTTSAILDRTGTRYENVPIEPEVKTDQALEAARDWIHSQ